MIRSVVCPSKPLTQDLRFTPMRVAFLSFDFAEYCIQQANGLAGECDLLLMLPEEDAQEYQPLLDPAVRYRPFKKPRLRQPLRQFAVITALLQQIRRFRPDVIHFQNGHLWFNFALPWLKSYPIVMTIHNPRHHVGDHTSMKTPQSVLDYGFRRADQVIVHGELLKRTVITDLGIASHKVHVIPHVSLGAIDPPPPAAPDLQRILFFGRIWKYKGLEYLIHAQPLINAAMPNARIVIAGQGDDFEPYRRMMPQPDRFEVHNRHISAADRDALFRQATVVVLPYIEATQSGVIHFANSYEKPVIATRIESAPGCRRRRCDRRPHRTARLAGNCRRRGCLAERSRTLPGHGGSRARNSTGSAHRASSASNRSRSIERPYAITSEFPAGRELRR